MKGDDEWNGIVGAEEEHFRIEFGEGRTSD